MKRDVLVGMLLVNTVPHALMGMSGKRCRTPFGGVSSTARQNLAWAALNLGAAVTVLACGGWATTSQREAERRRVLVEAGMCAMTVFGVVYEATGGQRDRRDRSDLAGAAGAAR